MVFSITVPSPDHYVSRTPPSFFLSDLLCSGLYQSTYLVFSSCGISRIEIGRLSRHGWCCSCWWNTGCYQRDFPSEGQWEGQLSVTFTLSHVETEDMDMMTYLSCTTPGCWICLSEYSFALVISPSSNLSTIFISITSLPVAFSQFPSQPGQILWRLKGKFHCL